MAASGCPDVLLKEVSQAFTLLAVTQLRPLLREPSHMIADGDHHHHRLPTELALQLLVLHHRSTEAFKDFENFYCMRLLLDEQSPLASYFIDFFSQLHWMLDCLQHLLGSTARLDPLQTYVRRVAHTCLFLYIAQRVLPWPAVDGRTIEEFKRVGRVARMFSSNEFHCRMRQLGFVNLDQQGQPVVNLRERLGSGAYATVYKGIFQGVDNLPHTMGNDQEKLIGEPVAVKMFASSNPDRSEFGTGFGRQLLHSMRNLPSLEYADLQMLDVGDAAVKDARLKIELGRLVSARHPNIITPRGYIGERPEGECGLVMEVMDESLHEYLEQVAEQKVPPLTVLDKLDLMLEIAKGMRFLHECNLMHRDLKPRNVLLRYLTDQDLVPNYKPRFEVKLADFGLAQLYSIAAQGQQKAAHEDTSGRVGTACYMAPELRVNTHQKVHCTEKVDVFSYGTTCFNILIGNPDAMAFSRSAEDFYEAVKSGELIKWVRNTRSVDSSQYHIVNLIAQCWSTDPSIRPTFATLCLLLAYGVHCVLLSPSYASVQVFSCSKSSSPALVSMDPFSSGHLEKLQEFESSSLMQREIKRYASPVLGKLQAGEQVIGLEIIQRFVEEINELKRPGSEGQEVFVTEFAKDVNAYLQAYRKGCYKQLEAAWCRARKPVKVVGMLPEISCWTTPADPLISIRGLMCSSVLEHYQEGARGPQPFAECVDFEKDAAHCKFQVDASLVPLLAGFTSLKNPLEYASPKKSWILVILKVWLISSVPILGLTILKIYHIF